MGAHGVKVLAFDCSTAHGSVAVVENGATLFAETFESPRGRGGEFFPALERAVRAAGKFDRVAVGIGPGSYNGLRAAIAAAEGLHIATGAERVGVASPLALAEEEDFFAMGDARSGQFWLARVTNGAAREAFSLVSHDALLAALDREPAVPRIATAELPGVARLTVAVPDAVRLGRLGRLGAGEMPALATLEPIYLKPAHITTARKREKFARGQFLSGDGVGEIGNET